MDRMARGQLTVRRLLKTSLIVALLSITLQSAPGNAQPRGFRLEGLGGGELTAGDLDQGTTVVVVWASWSPRCRDIVARTRALGEKWGDRARVITVDFQEDPEAVRAFLQGQKMNAPVYLDEDGAFSKRYAVTHLPGLLVFQDGQTRFSGRLSRDPDTIISQSLQ